MFFILQGTYTNDLLMIWFCTLCALVQEAQVSIVLTFNLLNDESITQTIIQSINHTNVSQSNSHIVIFKLTVNCTELKRHIDICQVSDSELLSTYPPNVHFPYLL